MPKLNLPTSTDEKGFQKIAFKWAIPALFFFFIFVFSTVNSKYVQYEMLPMTGFERWTSGIGRDRSANWATTISNCLLGNLFCSVFMFSEYYQFLRKQILRRTLNHLLLYVQSFWRLRGNRTHDLLGPLYQLWPQPLVNCFKNRFCGWLMLENIFGGNLTNLDFSLTWNNSHWSLVTIITCLYYWPTVPT